MKKTDEQLGSDIYPHPCIVQEEHISFTMGLKSLFLIFNLKIKNKKTDTIE